MTFLDREHSWARGRTTRELLFLAGGVGIIALEFARPGPVDAPNLAVYVLATLLLAVRFYAARAAGVATCIAALAQQWPHLRDGDVTWETLGVLPLAGISLLACGDLVARFDRAPSRVRWLPNPWAAFTADETRTLRWSAYAAGALAGLLDHLTEMTAFSSAAASTWPRGCMIALTAALLLLCVGRAIGLLGVWLAGLVVVAFAATEIAAAERVLAARSSGDWSAVGDVSAIASVGGHYVLPIVGLAAIAVALTTPAVLRLLRRTLLG